MSIQADLGYYAYSLGWSTVRRMPEKTAYRTFDVIADRIWSRRGSGVAQLEKNLSRVRPEASYAELRKLSRQSMRKYFRYWCDAFRMPDWSRERIVSTFEGVDDYRLDDALAQNKGVVVALCHMGNWDHGGAWASLTKAPLTAVAEKLEPEKLFEKFLEYRSSLGMQIYPLGMPNVTNVLADELRNDHRIVALVADRDLTARGVDVDFFGDTTRMPTGPANLALRTGAPLLAATLYYEGPIAYARFHEQIVVPPGAPTGESAKDHPGYAAAVADMTQQVARGFEEGISDRPTDWHMLQKLWLADLDQERLAQSDAAGGRAGT
ncbi:MAG: phosphatidylinositol mannoside acyltransferase [Candidatus Nanopelagicales bacterium]